MRISLRIRAEVAEENQGIKYKIENGIFKDIADRAAKAVAAKEIGLSQAPDIWKISIGRAHEKKCVIAISMQVKLVLVGMTRGFVSDL